MKIRFIVIMLLVLCQSGLVLAQHYTPVEQSSVIQFKVEHQMIFKSTVTGTFTGLKGTIAFDPNDLAASSFRVSVAVETINSGIGMRDNHLKKDEYFDAQKYPLISIKSQSITRGAHDGAYIFSGTLTLKGITKSISFPFAAKPLDGGYEFKGSFELNRLEYNVGPDNSIDKNVEVDLSVLAR